MIYTKALRERASWYSDPDLFLDAAEARVEYGTKKNLIIILGPIIGHYQFWKTFQVLL